MTYTVSSGTLTLVYHTIGVSLLLLCSGDTSRMSPSHETYLLSAETDEQRKDWIRAIKQCLYSVSGGGTVLCVCVSYEFCVLLFLCLPCNSCDWWMSLHDVYSISFLLHFEHINLSVHDIVQYHITALLVMNM